MWMMAGPSILGTILRSQFTRYLSLSSRHDNLEVLASHLEVPACSQVLCVVSRRLPPCPNKLSWSLMRRDRHIRASAAAINE